MSRVLITGGAGFVGSALAVHLKRSREHLTVIALDNLRRRGSELALGRLKSAGVEFVHGDIRVPADIDTAGRFDVMIECSAEPSVHAGLAGDPSYVVGTNLLGTIACLESARRHGAGLLFLSTSRVYPIAPLRALPLEEGERRLSLPPDAVGPGWSASGITTAFPLTGHRTLYGATKLASELLIEEYREMYDLSAVVTRFGVIAGPWQMGRVDQGFVALWAARHLWGERLSYNGFGGHGRQVRDVLHVDDMCGLIERQLDHLDEWSGQVLNAGGGPAISVSLRELTALCEERSGRRLTFTRVADTAPADIPYYVSDNRDVQRLAGWVPQRSLEALLDDTFAWLRAEERAVRPILDERRQSVRGA
jgi:CDP-paratose 2-epimerase